MRVVYQHSQVFIHFFLHLFNQYEIILKMVHQDLKNRYLANYLGILWAFIQPIFSILVIWFVFSVGFRAQPMEGFPFILWLVSGMIPFQFLSDGINNGTNSILEYNFLVKKIVFRVSLLPIVKILSAFYIHVFFMGFVVCLFLLHGFWPTLYWLQLPYYFISGVAFLWSISIMTSTIVVFFKDLSQIINMLLQILFWITPIFWSSETVDPQWHFWIQLNPFNYIVSGYRNTLVYQHYFWESPWQMLYFWSIVLLMGMSGFSLYKKLRPHFAEVL